jgi:hypothetical protein
MVFAKVFYIKPLPKHSFPFWAAYRKHGMEVRGLST